MAKVGVREISRRTGFSPATVSNALNHKRGVSKETTEKILRVASELGYKRPGKIEGVRFVLARRSGNVLNDGLFHLGVIEGVEAQASALGLKTTFTTLDLLDTANARQLAARICDDPLNGIILLGTEMEEEDYDLFIDAAAAGVVCDGWSNRYFFESIVTSNENSAYRAVSYLIQKGHREIGYICGSTRIRNFPLRERGYRHALRENGLAPNPDFRVEVGVDVDSAFDSMSRWLAGNPLLPTAFFVENDTMAFGCMRAMEQHGIKIPEEVSVFGFDDLNLASIATPPLSTMHIPNRIMGELAVTTLVDMVQHPRDYTRVTHLSTTLVERESVRDLTQA